jgi:hypothetical protein
MMYSTSQKKDDARARFFVDAVLDTPRRRSHRTRARRTTTHKRQPAPSYHITHHHSQHSFIVIVTNKIFCYTRARSRLTRLFASSSSSYDKDHVITTINQTHRTIARTINANHTHTSSPRATTRVVVESRHAARGSTFRVPDPARATPPASSPYAIASNGDRP